METPAQATAMSSAPAAQEHRAAQLRRAFQRVLKRRPTTIERIAMSRAAALTARAEAAALDPDATLDDVVRIDNAASRARAKLVDLIGALGHRRHRDLDPLALLNGDRHG